MAVAEPLDVASLATLGVAQQGILAGAKEAAATINGDLAGQYG